MADWYFASFEAWAANPWIPDGATAQTAWYRGTNLSGAAALNLSVLASGDTLWILDDHDSDTIDGYLQGTPPTGLTVRGDFPGRPGTLKVVGFNTSKDLTITNLRVTGGSFGFREINGLMIDSVEVSYQQKGFVAVQESNLDHVTIRNSTFHHLTHEGIECFARVGYTRDDWTIEDNEIHDVGYDPTAVGADYEGIGVQRLTHATIRRNHIYRCRYGINLWESGTGVAHDVVITRNHVHDMFMGPSDWPSRGIMMSGGSTVEGSLYNIEVSYNTVHAIGREGIRLQSPAVAQGMQVFGNCIASVGREFGTANSQHLVAPSPWVAADNLMLDALATWHQRRASAVARRSWTLF